MLSIPVGAYKRDPADMKQQLAAAATGQSGTSDSALRQAILQVVSIWLNRLSLVSGIATFFASIDSLLFSLASTATHLGDPASPWSATDKLTTASFAGALIFHVCSAILAFVASFVLVRLQLLDADYEEVIAGGKVPGVRTFFTGTRDPEVPHAIVTGHGKRPSTSSVPDAPSSSEDPLLDASNAVISRVTVKRVHPLYFLSLPSKGSVKPAASQLPDAIMNPPIELLARCHTLAVWMSVIGFILGVIGIITYAWVATPLAVSIFSIACLGACFLTGAAAVW
ncbi:uncharacterized protein FIBRA_06069 [Fibroporia radiculosa]|uniref:Uncharacterized protein n=1 Tax=Fibroporia radiculosa TaxID=599839 RepID=J4GAL8_9APHY|nr:uncharacterized protein FIBRA_06069 [Fibroporia radiculosa]CCM03918.1 predicted protein [Fibroporia radiculosa]